LGFFSHLCTNKNEKMKRFILFLAVIISTTAFAQNLRPVRDAQSKKYGYQNERRRWVVNPQFDDAERFRDGFAKVRTEGLVGLVDEKGKIVFAPQFDRIDKWDGDMAMVSYNGRLGLISRKGKIVVKPAYDAIGKFEKNVAVVGVDGKSGLIDITGKVLLEPVYDEIGPFVNGTAQNMSIVRKDGKCGLVNIEGKVVVEPKYSDIEPFAVRGRTYVKDGRFYGIISEDGTVLCQPVYINKFDFNGVGVACNGRLVGDDEKYGFVDNKFNEISAFDKSFLVRDDDRFFGAGSEGHAIYNAKGELLKSGFKAFNNFEGDYVVSGFVAVMNEAGKWGFCDKNGNMLIDFRFDNVGSDDGKSFSNGYCCVNVGPLKGFIDTKGVMTIPPRFNDEVNSFVADKDKNLTASIMYRGTQFHVRVDGSMICEVTDVNAEWTWVSQMGLIKQSQDHKFGAVPPGINWILGRWIVVDEYQKDTGKAQGTKTGRIVYDFMYSETLPDGSITGALWITRRGKALNPDGSTTPRGETTVHVFNFNGAEILVDDVPMPVLQMKNHWYNIKIDDRLNSPQYVHLIKMVE